ncbi:D-aminoacyl-tRNA deacylase [Clostridium sporogenes]|uniref:D-aminoacyl-tRNA deacylase n=1 Tax=Clostridium sporogenes TaxID=1509 RepID=A0ABD6RSY7_CLOSG|nr:D-aminoacyl-tRNA deacylase [Clostridium sporogenes]EKS4343236.1 D-tyrosyl-tRNA(Tyr) deacylase [Clostridium botulinum]EDU35788.1 D-tyrosyl-tRNA(Tyr) deacylase [Clostridium sporogenes ATCC 15579]EKS4396124.1 D-tyrosyl-tRNA(Tyr) deacylase [Clostridium botulinum]MCR1972817.1 D-aminoacyl-tRNA deacylase [Clostridium sporogenes]MCW6080315.1 D-tyrosyl-tRNA(Tyr) deacylase [Clostridium sporogenes]
MRAVVQRVISSKVEVDGKVIGSIGKGLNVLLGISREDTEEDIKYLKEKIINLRIFEDENEKLNKSLLDIGGDIIIVSQFTLYGDCRKGRRPSFVEALGGEEAYILYNKFVESIKREVNNVATGEFGADMKVYIENDGPVTILLDSKKTF